VTAGPYKVNGVPLRRVNQAYVIATSAKVNLEGVALPAIDDAYFAKEKASKKTKEEKFFAQSAAVRASFVFVRPMVWSSVWLSRGIHTRAPCALVP
jgi:ribosomal protein L14E/L6E/L27E